MSRLRLALVLLAPLASAACAGGGKPPFQFGIQAVALNLAFAEPELAKPVAPNVIVRLFPAPPGLDAGNLGDFASRGYRPTYGLPPSTACPKAPDGSVPDDVVTFAVTAPPTAGTYQRHNLGTIGITGGAFPITVPFPGSTRWQVGAGAPITTTDPVGRSTTVTQYEVRKVLSPTFIITDRYEIRSDRVVLVERMSHTDAGDTVFHPSPAIDFFVFGQEGDTWSSGGVDLERGTSMVVQGKIESREVVDVCGDVFDTFRVSSSETTVDLRTGDTSGTPQDNPNIYNVATQLGGLIVRENVHETFTTKDKASGTPIVITFDYISTVDSVDPIGTP